MDISAGDLCQLSGVRMGTPFDIADAQPALGLPVGDPWHRAAEAAGEALGAAAVMMLRLDVPRPTVLTAVGLDAATLAKYRDHWSALDPFLAAVPGRLGAGEAKLGSGLVAPARMRGSAFWSGFFAPRGFGGALVAMLPGGGDVRVVLYALRAVESGPFGARDVAIARAVVRSLAAPQPFGPLPAPVRVPGECALLDRCGVAAMMLDGDGRVAWENAEARSLLGAAAALRVVGGRLHVCDAVEREPLDRAITAARAGREALAVLGREGRGGLVVRALPVPSEPGERVLLLVADADQPTLPSVESLMAGFGLTRVHAQLFLLLLIGRDTAEIADEMRISKHTLRGYLTTLLYNFGVRSRFQLVTRWLPLVGLMSVLPASRPGLAPSWPAMQGRSTEVLPGVAAKATDAEASQP